MNVPRRSTAIAVAAFAWLAAASCEPCAGTVSCTGAPELSYGGQFIQHRTGLSIGGVRLMFVRESGIGLVKDTLTATTDENGYFQMREVAMAVGDVVGHLIVTPPAPWPEYTVQNLQIRVDGHRGNGIWAGRLVVDPYLPILGELHYRKNFARITEPSTVKVVQVSGPTISPDTNFVTTDPFGRFFVNPTVSSLAPIELEAIVTLTNSGREFRSPISTRASYIDRPAYDLYIVQVGSTIAYIGEALRRGTRELIPGVTVEFRRTGGIPVSPEVVTAGINEHGHFAIVTEPLQDGTLIGDLTITPPPPYLPEVHRDIQMATFSANEGRFLGFFGFGPQVYMRARVISRATDSPFPYGTLATVTRTGGVATVGGFDGLKIEDGDGVAFIAASLDTGTVSYDIAMDFAGFATEHMPVTTRARNSDVPLYTAPIRTGPWYPWIGELRDSVTNGPVEGARVIFQKTSGAATTTSSFVTSSDAAGKFRFRDMPIAPGAVTGTITITRPGYRTVVVTGVTITPSQTETTQSLGVYKLPWG